VVADPRLIAPATAAVLDGWCGPVVADAGADDRDGLVDGVCLGASEHPRGFLVWHDWGGVGSERIPWEDLRLDFSRAEVRDRVARVLSALAGAPGALAPWWMGRDTFTRGPLDFVLTRPGSWHDRDDTGCTIDAWVRGRAPMHAHERACLVVEVPALADLDPSDDTRLPDGSRLVDALALAAVYREVCCG